MWEWQGERPSGWTDGDLSCGCVRGAAGILESPLRDFEVLQDLRGQKKRLERFLCGRSGDDSPENRSFERILGNVRSLSQLRRLWSARRASSI